ncbi:MAG: lyase family protein [Acidilobaceae archaeon]|nr:lyase family protein [Acidilobaceae archaeon]
MYRAPLLGHQGELLLRYTSSLQADRKIVCEVLEVLEAHVEELRESHLIPHEASEDILRELRALKGAPEALFAYRAEDVHEAIEMYLREKLGERAGYVGLGRSRNDHVAAALRLKTARLLLLQLLALAELRSLLLDRAEEWAEVLMPSYTHFRPAQVSTLSLYLASVDEMLSDYSEALAKAFEIALKSPLGAGASAGVSAPLSRERAARRLFLGKLVTNALYASGSRDFLTIALALSASLAVALSRVAEDLILLSSPQIGYFSLPSEHLATSSIMPHKKNPVTLEIARAAAGEALGNLVAALSILKGLPSGYSLDMQQVNLYAVRSLELVRETLLVLRDIFQKIEISREAMRRDLKEYPVLAPDLAEIISMKTGRPFREVHAELAALVKEDPGGLYGEVERRYGVKADEEAIVRRPVKGSSNPEEVREYVKSARGSVGSLRKQLEELWEKIGPSCSPSAQSS